MPKTARWPYSQNDPNWADVPMWDREKVIESYIRATGKSRRTAETLLHKYKDGNTIGNEGCMLTCSAMILRLLDPNNDAWNPRTLNLYAQKEMFYSNSGISMVPYYSDLVSDASNGNVQLCAKEEYRSGEPGWPPNSCSTSLLVRAYRRLTLKDRRHFVVMLKTGTHDDTFASHYLLIDPDNPGDPKDDDPRVLDPAKGVDDPIWKLNDSEKNLLKDHSIKAERKKWSIKRRQISGVWLFGRWTPQNDRLLLGPMAALLADEYSAK